MKTLALIDASGLIINRIVIDDGSDWAPPEGCTTVEETEPMELGASYIGGVYTPLPRAPAPPSPPQSILSQDLMAQFTIDDMTAIKAAVDGNVAFWSLWSAMQAQKDPMIVTNARFLAGWAALITVLGSSRMAAIATALGVTI